MQILLVEDDKVDAMACTRALKTAFRGAAVVVNDASTKEPLLALDTSAFDCILLDYALPIGAGSAIMRDLKAANPDLPPVVMVTGANDERIVMETMREGAEDYVFKDEMSPPLLRRIVNSVLERDKLKKALLSSERRMTQIALHDDLTALGNRALFQRSLDRLVSAGERGRGEFGLVIVDVDRFKAINDAHGHLAGDAVLREAGRRLQSLARTADLAFRIGSDEFALLVDTGVTADGLRILCARIENALGEPCAFGEQFLTVSASAGAAVYPADGVTADALFSAADAAMHAAKRSRV